MSRALIVTGAGGVGKTTIAAALAVASARAGNETLVMTVDPARRLADALGLEEVGNEPTATPEPGLSAAMLDAAASWHHVVERTAPAEAADRLLASPFFDAISQRFPAGQGFAAGEEMTTQLEERRWDLVIVDTPPSQGGMDFFLAPQRIRHLVGGRLLRWLTGAALPGRRRLYRFTAGPALKLADAVIGSRLLEEVAEFLLDLRTAYDGLTQRARQIEHRFHQARVVVVTTASPAPVAEAGRFFAALPEAGAHPEAVVFNRTLPESWAVAAPGSGPLAANLERWGAESLHQSHVRREFAARHRIEPGTIPWQAEAPTGLDALRQLTDRAQGLDFSSLGVA